VLSTSIERVSQIPFRTLCERSHISIFLVSVYLRLDKEVIYGSRCLYRAKAKELDQLLAGSKRMIIRGATGRKMPHGRVQVGDTLYFINNNGEGKVRASAVVKDVFSSDKMTTEESIALVEKTKISYN